MLLTQKNTKIQLKFRFVFERQLEYILAFFLKQNLLLLGVDCYLDYIICSVAPVFYLGVIVWVGFIVGISAVCDEIAPVLRVSAEQVVGYFGFLFVHHTNTDHGCNLRYFKCAGFAFQFSSLLPDWRIKQPNPIGISLLQLCLCLINDNNIPMAFLGIEVILYSPILIQLENLHNLLNIIPTFNILLQLFKQILKLLQLAMKFILSISIIQGIIGFIDKVIGQYELIQQLYCLGFGIFELLHIFTPSIDIIHMISKVCTRHFPHQLLIMQIVYLTNFLANQYKNMIQLGEQVEAMLVSFDIFINFMEQQAQ